MPDIMCPSCQRKLRIPDAAVGKKVKCPCGTVLRAGGASAAAGPAPTRPTAAQAGARPTQTGARPTQAGVSSAARATGRTAPAATQAAPSVDHSLWDDLTENDLRSPYLPAGPTESPRKSEADVLSRYVPNEGGRRRVGTAAGSPNSGESVPRPIGLTLIGIWNFVCVFLYVLFGLLMLGLVSILANSDEPAPDGLALAGIILIVVCAVGMISSLSVGVLVFVAKKWAWFVVAGLYAFYLGDAFMNIVVFVVQNGVESGLFGAITRIGVTLSILSYLNSDDVRNYFRAVFHSPTPQVIVNGLGILLGLASGSVGFFVDQE